MKTVKVKGLEIKPPKGSAFAYETAPMLPKVWISRSGLTTRSF
jgi:hypothetical protein